MNIQTIKNFVINFQPSNKENLLIPIITNGINEKPVISLEEQVILFSFNPDYPSSIIITSEIDGTAHFSGISPQIIEKIKKSEILILSHYKSSSSYLIARNAENIVLS